VLRVGLVCPYSLDAPGGVQNHVLGLAAWLRSAGHHASVLAPGRLVPDGVTSAGRSLPVRANGSVARLALGPAAARRARAWLEDGRFDLVHLHEPANPSLCLTVLRSARQPMVGTFHAAADGLWATRLAGPLLGESLARLAGRIAVSAAARRTASEQLPGPAPQIVPNGLDVGFFTRAEPRPAWQGDAARPTVAVIGRFREPRKGLPVLVRAATRVRARRPGVRFLLLGRGPAPSRPGLEPLGPLGEADKAALLRSVDVFVAPHTGGESFGVVLAEAMAGGAAVLASDLPAFGDLLDGGRLGRLVPAGDGDALAAGLLDLLADPGARARYREAAAVAVRQYDWDRVGPRVLGVYEQALSRPGVDSG
jgi:phosphatidylinositol alpha-mannosyltransferase